MAAATSVYQIPRSFRLRMELEYAEKGHDAKDSKDSRPKSPHEAWCTFGLGDLPNPATYDNQLCNWNCTVIGPQNTNLGDRIYSLKVKCGPRYPDVPPEVQFLNKINMPGVDPATGKVTGVMKSWSRKNSIMDYLVAIRSAMEGAARLRQPGPSETWPPVI